MHSDRIFKEAPLPLDEHTGLKELTVESILLEDGSRAEGKSPRELNLAEKTGVLIIAVKRGDELLGRRLADSTLQSGDVIYCIGQMADLVSVSEWLDPNFKGKRTS
jgi:uncharacterized protein with PhoU and TrkA domain